MKILRLVLIVFALITGINCHGQHTTKPMQYSISGSIENIDSVKIYLKRTNKNNIEEYLNETLLVNGKFEMTGIIAVPEVLYIHVGEKPFKSFLIFLSGDDISIRANYDSLGKAEITGARYQKDLDQYFENFKTSLNSKNDSIDFTTAFNKSAVDAIFMMIEEYPESPAIPYIVEHSLNFFELEDLLKLYDKLDKSSSHLKTVETNFSTYLIDTQTLQILRERIVKLEMVAVGKKYTDFTLPDTSGSAISISDYEGKYILIDFWASWCSPCRAEHPELMKLYQKYEDKGFEVIGVSFDENLARWKKAIINDSLEWVQMSAPKGWNSEIAKTYVFGGIPNNFIIGPVGTILARNLHGKTLEAKLKEIFGY